MPKSPSFRIPSEWMKMFAVLMSLWTIYFRFMNKIARHNYDKYLRMTSLVKAAAGFFLVSSFFNLTRSSRFPRVAYSITIYILFLYWKFSKNLMKVGPLSTFKNTTSFWTSFYSLLPKYYRSIILIAYCWLSRMFKYRATWPAMPWPRCSISLYLVRPSSYWCWSWD